ncbi:MAG: hypothetical protein AVDCRST_MAG87-1807 [uncultured Thermomicrobiales bacterium]|uniref:Uncharacterized protein n=1 Tax=uncultured Thermomicrobiales bacterium TaxID=1645740 RepID=A0A6J4V411_9BACT|nr:MAG: hypothetical protein AVDCRST_MAG87-1807 [uncultured Thermomicrobiales bacterium]
MPGLVPDAPASHCMSMVLASGDCNGADSTLDDLTVHGDSTWESADPGVGGAARTNQLGWWTVRAA